MAKGLKYLLLLLLILGCDYAPTEHTHSDHTHSELEDKHGCLDGQATNYDATASMDNNTCTYIDSCGVIDTDKTNDCVQDCAGEWGGESVDDCDGVCNGDAVVLWELHCFPTDITSIELNFQGLHAPIPPEIGNLTNLTNLNLYNNQLTGEIPVEIGNLTSLITLSLGSNQLSGEIPPEIGNLTNLYHLDLYINHLTGEIPPELGNLTNLAYLNLNYNQLTGEIPQEVCDLIESNNLGMWNILSENNLTNTCE